MMTSKPCRRSSGRSVMHWRVRAIRRDPLDPRLLARLFIQMALERAETERAQPNQATPDPNTSRP
jgi:hypothetical protein